MFELKKIDIAAYSTRSGTYHCSKCDNPLFDACKQFDAGCGFPSFWLHKDEQVIAKALSTYGRERIQLLCSKCDQHLGHLFDNPYTPSKVRYCVNANSIRLQQ